MKFFLACFLLAWTLGACRTSASKEMVAGGDSELQAVYDDDYALRLAKVDLGGEAGYRFESCFSDGKGRVLESSCVAALRSHKGEEVILTLQSPDDLKVSEPEATLQSRMDEKWQHYRSRIDEQWQHHRAQLPSDSKLTAGAVVLGGTGMLGGVAGGKAVGHAEKVVNYLNSQTFKEAGPLDPDKVAVDTFYGADRYRPFATLGHIEDAVQVAESELRAQGLDPTKMPQVTAPELNYKTDLIVSEKFQDFFELELRFELRAKGYSSLQALQDPLHYINYTAGTDRDVFKTVVQKFLKKGHKVSDIFYPRYFKDFKAYYLIERKLYEGVTQVGGLERDIIGPAARVFHEAHAFVLYKGVPDQVRRRVEIIKKGKEAIHATRMAAKMIHPSDTLLTAQKARGKQMARAGRKLFSAKMLRGLSVAAVVAGAVVGGVLVLEKTQVLKKADEPQSSSWPSASKEHYKVFMDLEAVGGSEKVAVLSVKEVLMKVGSYLQDTAWVVPGASVEFYCLPAETSGEYQQKCELVSL